MIHLSWHKPRQTILGSKIEALADDHPSKSKCLSQLAELFGKAGNITEQKRLLTHTLELERRRGNDSQVAATLRYLSDTNRLLNLHEEGIWQMEEALEIAERIGDTIEQAECLNNLAYLLFEDGEPDAAEKAASRAIDLVPETGQEYLACDLHLVLGRIYRSKGEKEKALHHFETSLRIASPFDWHRMLYWIHYSLAQLFGDGGELDDESTHIEQAKAHAVDCSMQYELGRAMQMQARVWYEQLRLEDAKSEALYALEIFEKLGEVKAVEICRRLLQNVERAIENESTRPPSELLGTTLHPMPTDFRPTRLGGGGGVEYIPPSTLLISVAQGLIDVLKYYHVRYTYFSKPFVVFTF
jgi:tetratricopeptide (TPR) repeat protein